MVKQYLGIHVIIIFSLIQHHNRDEIEKSYRGHLVLVNLRAFNGDQLVADIFSDVELAAGLKNMGDHTVVFSFQQS